MRYPKGRSYCNTEQELQQYRCLLKSMQCPHCGRVGFLVCHGCLKGFSAMDHNTVCRGWRFFCSNRYRRGGCGRTYSVLLSEFIRGFIVTTHLLWQLLVAVGNGQTVRKAWLSIAPVFCMESGHRLWRRLLNSQSRLKTRLCRERPPPNCNTAEPMLQPAAHFTTVFPLSSCPFTQFQSAFQESLL